MEAYLSLNPLRESTCGKPVVTVPIILYSDDMSGNKSKKWHEFNNWCLLLAGLPRHLNSQLANIHLISFSDSVSTLHMAEPIADELLLLENEGLQVFDAHLRQNVHVFAPLLLCICDNPRASELLNHRGSNARKFCRMCMVSLLCYNCTYVLVSIIEAWRITCRSRVWRYMSYTCLQVDRCHDTTALETLRTKSQSLQQITQIRQQRTESEKNILRVEYGLGEHHNPFFSIPADLYRYVYIYMYMYMTRQQRSRGAEELHINCSLFSHDQISVCICMLVGQPHLKLYTRFCLDPTSTYWKLWWKRWVERRKESC